MIRPKVEEAHMKAYRGLTDEEVSVLEGAGCSAEAWSGVQVADGFDPARVRNVTFSGSVKVGALGGTVSVDGVDLPSGVTNATLVNCELGDSVRVANIGSHIANYRIGDGAVVTDVGRMATQPGATFGNGVELEPVNEGGGREFRIFNEMSSQFAYMACMHRYRKDVVKQLETMVDAYIESVKSDTGTVGEGALVSHVGEIVDVNIGPYANVSGAASLKNGTILSEEAAPAEVGAGVMADDFIIGEGSSVTGGAVLGAVFVGQGVKVGKQFSGENSLFFANCECYHGEACSIFGGPYTVTHHKSSLLIAAMFSFYNAGSATNQSNHMYKLGPVHQGLLERGSKTGSSSYLLWPSVVGPFSVVIGKHFTNFDLRDMPFSYITEEKGQSLLTPAMNLSTVGTVRDGEKWPARDRRKSTVKRDLIRFEVFSPYTVGKMIRGEAILDKLYKDAPKGDEEVRYKGITIKRLVIRFVNRNYRSAIDTYLNGKIADRAGDASSPEAIKSAMQAAPDSVYSDAWADVSGLLLAQDRLTAIEDRVGSGKIASVSDLQAALEEAWAAYPEDEWAWVRQAYEARTGKSVDALTAEDLEQIRKDHKKGLASNMKKILADAEKEFDDVAKMGFGIDGDEGAVAADFEAVRGTFEENSFVKQMQEALKEAQS
jgi:hypothetical protein